MGTAAGRLLGAVHGVELFYVFQTIERVDDFSDGVPAADATVAGIMLDRWTRFAATGTPTGTPAWPAYDDTDPSFVISADPTVERGIRDDRCDVWDRARLR